VAGKKGLLDEEWAVGLEELDELLGERLVHTAVEVADIVISVLCAMPYAVKERSLTGRRPDRST
jgi:hypothetical protein